MPRWASNHSISTVAVLCARLQQRLVSESLTARQRVIHNLCVAAQCIVQLEHVGSVGHGKLGLHDIVLLHPLGNEGSPLVPGSCNTRGVFRVRGTHIIGVTPLCRCIRNSISKQSSCIARSKDNQEQGQPRAGTNLQVGNICNTALQQQHSARLQNMTCVMCVRAYHRLQR